jgi:uncharacterized membrane protein
MLKLLRNALIAGFILIAPIGVTILVVNFVVTKVGGPIGKMLFGGDGAAGLEAWETWVLNFGLTLLVLVVIAVLGFLSNYFIGRIAIRWGEWIVERVPFVSTVYKTVKQIVDTFASQEKAVFQQVVLIEYPRKGSYAIGFLTSRGKGEVQQKTPSPVANVFVPTTPNPTSGFLLMIPEDDIIYLQMPIGEGMKLIISGGAVVPTYPPPEGEQTMPLPVQNPPSPQSSRRPPKETVQQ